jgi:hypothetical protein
MRMMVQEIAFGQSVSDLARSCSAHLAGCLPSMGTGLSAVTIESSMEAGDAVPMKQFHSYEALDPQESASNATRYLIQIH